MRALVDAVVAWAERELADGFHPTRIPVCRPAHHAKLAAARAKKPRAKARRPC